MKTERETDRAVELYADLVRRICFVHLKNQYDTEDVFQTVFLKYMTHMGTFESADHEKAWFIRVTLNACTDWLRSLTRHRHLPLELLAEEPAAVAADTGGVLAAVLALPEKYRDVIYLHYYEGYTAPEIAALLGRRESTVYTRLARGRALLKTQLGGEWE